MLPAKATGAIGVTSLDVPLKVKVECLSPAGKNYKLQTIDNDTFVAIDTEDSHIVTYSGIQQASLQLYYPTGPPTLSKYSDGSHVLVPCNDGTVLNINFGAKTSTRYYAPRFYDE